MSDLIERQAAIDALMDDLSYYGARNEAPYGMSRAIGIIKKLPPAQPQRMRGEWIEDGYNHYKAVCSECGEPCATYIMGKPRDKFCKWCGADMRKEAGGD